MSIVEVPLEHGLKLGEAILKVATLRESTAGDVIEAQEEAEKLIMVPDENGQLQPQLVPSPTMVGVHVLRRQIKSIDDVSGPLSLEQLKTLHPEDLNALQNMANKLDQAAEVVAEAIETRGRSDQSGENA
ncbi:MAG: phage tail assembly protein [Cycloclasticus sp.]